MTQKLDKLIYGILIGFFVPLIGSMIFFAIKNHNDVWNTFLNLSYKYPDLYIPYIKSGALLNLAPFFLFNHFDMHKSQKGIIFGTFIWVLVLVIYYIVNQFN
jgi:ABC-type Fe3+ transport system permease subunit